MLTKTQQGSIATITLLSVLAWAEPSPIADEAFLLFLAEMVDVEGELTDGLDLVDVKLEESLVNSPELGEAQQTSEEEGEI